MKENIPLRILKKAERIRLLLLDFDGVMTNGRITYTTSGEELKIFDVKDGFGIKLLIGKGVSVGIVTLSDSPIVMRRAKELGIQYVFQEPKSKLLIVSELAKKLGLEMDQVAYVGDDLPDIESLQVVGLACCPCDAVEDVKEVCHYILKKPGGYGAVREMCDIIRVSQR